MDVCSDEVCKIVVCAEDIQQTIDLANCINERFPDVKFIQSEGSIFTITHVLADKGAGIDFLKEKYHLKDEEVICFGDNHNDLFMFSKTKFPIAMANSELKIQKSAFDVCGSNDKNGVSSYIKLHLINK